MSGLAIGVALVLGPPLAIVWLQSGAADVGPQILAPVEALVVPVGAVSESREVIVTGHLVWSSPPELLSPGWSGRVTAVHIAPDELLGDGMPVVSIDGVTRRYAFGDAPIAVALGRNSRGSDVQRLQVILSRWGYYSGAADGSFGSAVQEAVRALQRDIGAVADGRFDPQLVVWGPEPVFDVSVVGAVVGGAPPALGESIALGRPPLEAVSLSDLAGDRVEFLPEHDWIVEFEGQVIATVVGSNVVEADLVGLAEVFSPETDTVEARVRLREPIQASVIPTGAVVTGPMGILCVWVPSGTGFEPVRVEPVGAVPGGIEIESGLLSEVLANPAQALADHICPAE